MSIGYLVSQFPVPSETFVSREVLTLTKLGLGVKPFAFSPPSEEDQKRLDAATRELMRQVTYSRTSSVLRGGLSALPLIVDGWQENARLHSVTSLHANRHLRLLRAARLASQLSDAGITHLHAHWPYATEIAYLVHQLTGISFSVSIHAHEVEHENGHFARVFPALSFATFCNRAAMDRLLQRLPSFARDKSHLIYHGVNLGTFQAMPFLGKATPLRVCSAGRLTPTKGFDRLLRACAGFRSLGGLVELTILGQGAMEKKLRRLASDLGLSEHFHLPGWLSHDQMAARMADCHVFALLADTNFHDGLPNVVLEAMACARPIILSPLPAASEAITDGVEGFILGSGEQEETDFIHALQLIAANPENLRKMGLAARRRVELSFDETLHARRLKELLLSEKPGPVPVP